MKKYALLITISAVLIAMVAFAVLFFAQFKHNQEIDLIQAPLKAINATSSVKISQATTSSVQAPQIATSSVWNYRNEENGFELKIPVNFTKYQDWGSRKGYFCRYFLGGSVEGSSTLAMKVNQASELTPLLPDQSSNYWISTTTKIKLFGGEIKENIVLTQDGKETSVFASFCLNKKMDLKDPEPDYNASEATMRCPQNYNFYDFSLLCTGKDSINCKLTFDKIISSFKLIE